MILKAQKRVGTQYTSTAALLAVAFVFSPALLILSGPIGVISTSVAVACSTLCLSWAWVDWHKRSRLTIPTIENLREGAE